uniref:Uncharacterized protein n=1 Tax=Cannabis sativa TaxID=3483 RepID=A0A803QYB0_CANSA
MAEVASNKEGYSYQEYNDTQKNVFDLNTFVGDLNVEEDTNRYMCGLYPVLNICKRFYVENEIMTI